MNTQTYLNSFTVLSTSLETAVRYKNNRFLRIYEVETRGEKSSVLDVLRTAVICYWGAENINKTTTQISRELHYVHWVSVRGLKYLQQNTCLLTSISWMSQHLKLFIIWCYCSVAFVKLIRHNLNTEVRMQRNGKFFYTSYGTTMKETIWDNCVTSLRLLCMKFIKQTHNREVVFVDLQLWSPKLQNTSRWNLC